MEIKKNISRWLKKTRIALGAENWLRKAEGCKKSGRFKDAIEAYLRFIEIKLKTGQYLDLAPYYIEIAECYKQIEHHTKEERVKDYENSVGYYLKAAQMYTKLGSTEEVNKCYLEVAKCYEESGENDNASRYYVTYHLEIAKAYQASGNYFMASVSRAKAAEYHKKLGEYENAALCYLEAAKANLKKGDIRSVVSYYKNAAESYESAGKYKDSVGYYAQAARVEQDTGHYAGTGDIYELMAGVYEKADDLKNAMSYYEKSAKEALGKGDYKTAGLRFRKSAGVYKKSGDMKNAAEHYLKAIEFGQKASDYITVAYNYRDLAGTYVQVKDIDRAGNAYCEYSRFAVMSGIDQKDGYENAALVYEKSADDSIKSKKYKQAGEHYKQAGDCLARIEDYKGSGRLYEKSADSMSKAGNQTLSVELYSKAADSYSKSGDLNTAGGLYAKSGDFGSSADSYMKYAQSRLKEKDYFGVADGYRNAAAGYEKLGKKDLMKDHYNAAIRNYLRYVELPEVKERSDINIAEAYRNVAECYTRLEDSKNSEKYFQITLERYEKAKEGSRKEVAEAFLLKARATGEMRSGNNEGAVKILDESVKLFDTSLKGKLEADYRVFVAKGRSEAVEMLQGLKVRPEISLEIKAPGAVYVGRGIRLDAAITNNGKGKISKIAFLTSVPETFDVIMQPNEIKSIEPGGSAEFSFEISAKDGGDFEIKPLEVFYVDSNGNKYMKSSNEIRISVKEKSTLACDIKMPAKAKVGEEFAVDVAVRNESKYVVMKDIKVDFGNLRSEFESGEYAVSVLRILPGQETKRKIRLVPKYKGVSNFDVVITHADEKETKGYSVDVKE